MNDIVTSLLKLKLDTTINLPCLFSYFEYEESAIYIFQYNQIFEDSFYSCGLYNKQKWYTVKTTKA